jgi:hypothetical protein
MFRIQQSSNARTRWFSGCLAVLVLLLSFASVSPQLHQALHTDSGDHHHHHHDYHHTCGGHEQDAPADDCDASCAVALFGQGVTTPQPLVELPERTDAIVAIVPLSASIVWCGQRLIRRCSRAPPIESVV